MFGTGYTQEIGDEMTFQLLNQRQLARIQAKTTPKKPVGVDLTSNGVKLARSSPLFTGTGAAKIIVDAASCQAGLNNPLSIGSEAGFTDD